MVKTRKCSFNNCVESSETGVKLFNFRKFDHMKWIEACKNPNLKKLALSSLLRNHYVCQRHFRSGDFTRQLSPFKNKLNGDAIPRNIDANLEGEYLALVRKAKLRLSWLVSNLGRYLTTYFPTTWVLFGKI